LYLNCFFLEVKLVFHKAPVVLGHVVIDAGLVDPCLSHPAREDGNGKGKACHVVGIHIKPGNEQLGVIVIKPGKVGA